MVRKLMRKTDKTDENKHDELKWRVKAYLLWLQTATNLEIYNKLKKLGLYSKFEIYLWNFIFSTTSYKHSILKIYPFIYEYFLLHR